MLRHSRSLLCTSALLATFATPMTWAQTSASHVPAFHHAGALQYSCGGIGSEESTAMRSAMKSYPLSLLFARKDGDYLADLKVEVQPAQGKAMQFTAGGPVCLLQLPAGAYTVKATTSDGTALSKSVQVGQHSQSLDFRY